MRIIVAISACLLVGCATVGNFVEKHPVTTAVVSAVVVGAAAAALEHRHAEHRASLMEVPHIGGPGRMRGFTCAPPTDVLRQPGVIYPPTCPY